MMWKYKNKAHEAKFGILELLIFSHNGFCSWDIWLGGFMVRTSKSADLETAEKDVVRDATDLLTEIEKKIKGVLNE